MESNLTKKQEKFCQEYFLKSNASEAYREAYNCSRMKPETIHSKASILLKNDKVRARIEILKAELYERNRATIDEVLSIAADMLRADISKAFNEDGTMKKIKDIPKAVRMAISGIETNELKANEKKIGEVKKIRFSDRNKVLEMFMKHFGAYDKHNEQKKSNITIFKLPDNGR